MKFAKLILNHYWQSVVSAADCLFRILIPSVINLVTRSKLSTNRLEISMGCPTQMVKLMFDRFFVFVYEACKHLI